MSVSASTRFSYLSRRTKNHLPVIPAPAQEQFRHNIFSLIRSTLMADQPSPFKPRETPGLKKIPPYWYPYTTMTKMRWIGRELLEVVSTEFRDRSMEYYVGLRYLSLCLRHNHLFPLEICSRVWSDNCQRKSR